MENTDTDSAGPMAEDGGLVAYFGFGSLVNRATHRTAIVRAVRARLFGWRRTWRPRPAMPGFPAALLTVQPEEGAVCDGLLVFDRSENLAAVDAREARYDRHALRPDALEISDASVLDCPAYVYVADASLPPDPRPPQILRSYLDAVMQGFLVEHGEEGLRRFMADTLEFGTAVHEDRSEPVYPRPVTLTADEQALFDALVAERSGTAKG